MHNAVYRALGLDWRYDLADRETEADAWEFIAAREWLALNVTTPWKRLAIQSTSRPSRAAIAAFGANVLVNWDGAVYADNTDGAGCVAYLRRCGVVLEGARVVVCGTGPTALAIMHACAGAGAGHIALMGRDVARCAEALASYRDRIGGWPSRAASWEADFHEDRIGEARLVSCAYDDAEARELLRAARVIVDATPLGMVAGDPAPFDTSALVAGQMVLDVVYGHGVSRLVSAARAAGCDAYDGKGMLVAQAVETVRDIARITGAFDIPSDLDLFDVMAEAAG